jgi:hypothetical protein
MKHSRKLNWTVVIIGALLILALFFARNKISGPNTQAEGNTNTVNPVASSFVPGLTPLAIKTLTPLPPDYPTHVAETQTAEPTMPPTATSTLAPPPCTFPLAQIKTTQSSPQNYTFSEPQVVLNAQGNLYNIVEWLPDNQQVLITRDLLNAIQTEPDKLLRQSIELYSPETNKSTVYAIRHKVDEPPAWQVGSNAVVYPDVNYLGVDQNTHRTKFTRQVWVSYGNPNATQKLADNLSQFPFAMKPDGSGMVYFSDKQIFKRNITLQPIPSISFDPSQWDYAKSRRNSSPVSYEMTWQPGTSLIFLHSEGGMQLGGGYTFILNIDTGKVCELNFGGWAVRAHWSSDGRFLAIVREVISSIPVDVTELAVLDTVTGKLYTATVTPQEGKHYVVDFVWAPDNHHLIALGNIPSQNTGQDQTAHHELYLVDFMTGQSVNILPEYKSFFADGAPLNNLAWSPDGSKLLILCPTMQEEHVCFVSVQRTGQ